MRLVKRFLGLKLLFTAAILAGTFVSIGLAEPEGLTLSAPRIIGESIVFSFASATNEILTVQRSDSVLGEWQDVTNYLGKGAQLEFSMGLEGSLDIAATWSGRVVRLDGFD